MGYYNITPNKSAEKNLREIARKQIPRIVQAIENLSDVGRGLTESELAITE